MTGYNLCRIKKHMPTSYNIISGKNAHVTVLVVVHEFVFVF